MYSPTTPIPPSLASRGQGCCPSLLLSSYFPISFQHTHMQLFEQTLSFFLSYLSILVCCPQGDCRPDNPVCHSSQGSSVTPASQSFCLVGNTIHWGLPHPLSNSPGPQERHLRCKAQSTLYSDPKPSQAI